MSRRRQSEKRKISPDPIYGSVDIEKFTNRLMKGGKKSIARKALYDAMEKIKETTENIKNSKEINKEVNSIKDTANIFKKEINEINELNKKDKK